MDEFDMVEHDAIHPSGTNCVQVSCVHFTINQIRDEYRGKRGNMGPRHHI